MKRRAVFSFYNDFIRWTISLLAFVVVSAGLLLAVAALIEQFRFVKAANQLLSVASIARDLKLNPAFSVDENFKRLFVQLQSQPHLRAEIKPTEKNSFLTNPWNNKLVLNLSALNVGGGAALPDATLPLTLFLVMNGDLPASACRHILNFFGNNPAALDLWQIGVRDVTTSIGRQIYNRLQGQSGELSAEAITAGCGTAAMVNLNLTFKVSEQIVRP